jgi:tetratricopeptide (TPR) repeat protein
MSAKVNLGNILYLRDQYARALGVYEEAIQKLESMGRNQSKSAMNIYLNISKCHYQLEQFGDARESYQFASAINQDQTSQYAYLAAADSSGAARASESDWNDILFLEEE